MKLAQNKLRPPANRRRSCCGVFGLEEHRRGRAVGRDSQHPGFVSPTLGIKSVADLVKLAKEKPGVLQYATAGRGSATHLTSELFNSVAGIQTVAVHYRGGGDTVKDLLSGEVKMMFSSIAPVQDFVRDGRLVGLATTGPKRDPAFPDLPTIAEFGYPGFDVRLWIGMTAPAATPKDIIHKLADANKKALESPEIQKALAAQRFAPMLGSAEKKGQSH